METSLTLQIKRKLFFPFNTDTGDSFRKCRVSISVTISIITDVLLPFSFFSTTVNVELERRPNNQKPNNRHLPTNQISEFQKPISPAIKSVSDSDGRFSGTSDAASAY